MIFASMAAAAEKPVGTKAPLAGAIPAPRFGSLIELFCRWAFAAVRVAPSAVEHVQLLAERGPVVYVMRQRSWVDYLLVMFVLRREGLPVPEFAGDLSTFWFRSIRRALANAWRRLREGRLFARELRALAARDRCQQLVREGRPVLLFMRARRSGVRGIGRRRRAAPGMRSGAEYLREIVHHQWDSDQHVALVPVAVLRGRGMRRKESRLATLVYSVQEMPGEIRRLISLLWNRHDTSISLGVEVELREFIRRYRREGEERVVRRLARALQIFLYREERLVWGPLLLGKRQVRQRVFEDEEVRNTVSRLAREGREAESQVWRRAERYFNEIAANFNGVYFAILEWFFNRIWPRLFQGFETSGLEKVVERVKSHPVVLVPCHRSHFDYLILSYVFHLNYLSPPHIAAGVNLSFWPLGPLFRGAGAYFIRRTFEGNELYKVVFRSYLTFLIREGYTQEFFIEGGRSRTGKILTPKLGMLSAIVEAFTRGVRRDLYLVPVSIHYGRVVEEEEYQRELGGAEKQPESLAGLLRARRVLRRRHGTVYLNFAEPISLNQTLGAERREAFRRSQDPAVPEEKRRFVQKLGFRLLREVNSASVAGATSISATVLLGLAHRACRHRDFVGRALALVRLLRWRGVRFTASLERNAENEFRESLGFLEQGGLVQRLPGEAGGVIYAAAEKRLALDFYKNNTIHFFLLPALVTSALCRGVEPGALCDDVLWWLELFRWEFALPEREETEREIGEILAFLCAEGAVEGADGRGLRRDHPLVASTAGILDNFREAYWVAAQELLSLPEGGLGQKALIERMRRRYRTGLLLGEVRKPEGNSSVTLQNALSRFTEVGCVGVRSGKGRERLVARGLRFEDLLPITERVARALIGV